MDISLEQAARLLLQRQQVVLTTHVHCDGDGFGAMLALTAALTARGKTAVPLLAEEVPPVFQFLPGADRVLVLPQPQASVAHADLLVCLDSSDIERVQEVRAAVPAAVLSVDHHVSNTRYGDYNLVWPQAAATGEIVFHLLAAMAIPLDQAMATCLYTAVATDCGFFRYANTTAATHLLAAELLRYGVNPSAIADRMETKPAAGIKLLAAALDRLEYYHDGRTAVMTLDMRQVPAAVEDATEGFINYPRYIEGVETALLFKVIDEQTVKVSMRSREYVDVSAIALSFGGGGHKRAAGCTISGGLHTAKTMVLREVAKQLAGGNNAGHR